jgi:sterol desaturase/sphingolipid hydroxylase (fatty acid hydroxylase superfamily)
VTADDRGGEIAVLSVVILIGFALLALERLRPGWTLPRAPSWLPRAIAANAAQLGVVVIAGLTWDRWLRARSLVHLGDHLGPWSSGAIAYVVSTFVYYWWHRARHASRLLWLGFHQLHHSPERIEILTSFYKHPAEQAADAILSSIIAYTWLGLTPAGGAVYTLLSALGEFAYHMNVRTPRWLGFFFQRPEMHRLHHERGSHAGNYGDLPIWDMLFGTYRNPATFDGPCGFDAEREARVGAMLALRDVHTGEDGTRGVPWARRIALGALLGLGLASVAGTALEPAWPAVGRAIGGFGKLSLASPFPKVFCRVGDEEPFGYDHTLVLSFADGTAARVPVDRAHYARFSAPYQHRNVYGAALAFASRLRPETVDAVIAHGLCDRGPLLALAGGELPDAPVVAVTVISSPRAGALGLARTRRVSCSA